MLRKLFSRAVSASQRWRARGDGTLAVAPGLGVKLAGSGTQYALVALLVPAFFLLYGLNAFPLRDNNEGLYAEIAREMLATGQYIVPHLNGVPYIEKPPLLYWLIALSMSVFGPTPFAARLVSALSMLALCAGLFVFCRRHGNARAGCGASVALASAFPVALLAHVVLFDPLLTALLGGALLCLLHSYLARSRPAQLAYAFLLALAVLEKGGVALMLAWGSGGLFLLLMRDQAGWRCLFDRTGLALLFLVAGWWHVVAAWQQAGFGQFYFINEHLLRFLGQRVPDDYHHGPIWFYPPRLLLMLLPWTPFLLLLVHPPGAPNPVNQTIVRFCQAAVLFPLVFFSLSQAKADYYMLVSIPALALWLAIETTARLAGSDRRLALCWGMSAALVVVTLVVASRAGEQDLGLAEFMMLSLACAAFATVGARFFRSLQSLHARELALLAVAVLGAPVLALVLRAVEARGGRDSSIYVARIILEHPQPERAVFIYRDFEDVFSTLPFYLGRTVPVIDSASRDLQFGCRTAPADTCLSLGEFLRLRERQPVAVAVKASRANEFLALVGERGWQAQWVADKMVFFDSH